MYRFSSLVLKAFIILSLISCTSSDSSDTGSTGSLSAKIEEKFEKFKGYFRVHTHREHVAEHKAQEELARRQDDEQKNKNEQYAQNAQTESKK